MEKIIWTRKNKLFTAIVATILILAITATLLIVFLPRDDDEGNKIIVDDTTPLIYSVEVRSAFIRSLWVYLSQFVPIQNTNALGNSLLTAFSKARIASDKVDALSLMLKTSKPDIDSFILKFFYYDEGHNLLPRENIETALMQELMTGIPQVTADISAKTGITEQEFAKLAYEILYISTDEAYKKLLEQIGRADFIILVIDTYKIAQAISASIKTGGDDTEARLIQEAVFSLGSSYKRIIAKIGIDKIESLLGIDYILDNVDTPDAEQLKKVVDSAKGLIGYSALMASELLTSIPNATAEAWFRYLEYQDKDIKIATINKTFGITNFARATQVAIDNSLASVHNTSNIKTRIDLVDRIATFATEISHFADLQDSDVIDRDYDAYKEIIKRSLEGYFANMDKLILQASGIDSITKLTNSSLAKQQELALLSAGFLEIPSALQDVFNEGIYSLLLNLILRISGGTGVTA